MHATQALDYLVLNASQRIDYRVEKGITLQQWYDSFKPEPLQGEDMGYREACQVLGVSKLTFYKLLDEGYFGEKPTGNGRRASVSGINRVLEREAYLIPVPAFKEILKEQQYHMSWGYFYDLFKGYFEEGVNKSQQYVSIISAAKIIYELRKRKVALEEWPTLKDLNMEFGLNFNNKKTMRSYFRRRIRDAGGQSIRVWTYDSPGKNDKGIAKIPPDVYNRVLAEERRKRHNEGIGISTAQIAKTMGLAKESVLDLIHGGVEIDKLHPLVGRRNYLFTPEEARLVIAREVPYMTTLKRREQTGIRIGQMETTLEQTYPNVQLDHFAEELWYKVKSGDQQAFGALLGLYEPIITKEASKPIFGMTKEERLMSLYTAFYEIIMESNMIPSNGRIIKTLRGKLGQRKIEEAPSWSSLDERIQEDSQATWLDFVDSEGHIVLR